MDRFVPLIGVEIHPVENGALEYKGTLHIMHHNHTEKLSPTEMWSLVHILEDGHMQTDGQREGEENRAVYMTKLVSMYKNLKCGYDDDIDKELCQIIKKEEDLFKTSHHRP